jgi:hypothetical protein
VIESMPHDCSVLSQGRWCQRGLIGRSLGKEDLTAKYSGATQHSLAQMLAEYATHSVIESLFVRFEVHQLPADTNPNKLKKAKPSGQALQNVIFEAGWAMALDQEHVILLLAGTVRKLSDIDGLNYVRITDDVSDRKSLINRLRNVALDVDDSGEEWRTAGAFIST